jgi:predicted RND superfamily exporter protein
MFINDWTILVPIATLIVIAVGLAHGITTSLRAQRRARLRAAHFESIENAAREHERESLHR